MFKALLFAGFAAVALSTTCADCGTCSDAACKNTNNLIDGNWNMLKGDRNRICGNENKLKGDDNTLVGH